MLRVVVVPRRVVPLGLRLPQVCALPVQAARLDVAVLHQWFRGVLTPPFVVVVVPRHVPLVDQLDE